MSNAAQLTPFHLAFGVNDLETTRQFYGEVLQCKLGRSTDNWQDFSLFGHQMSAHIRPASSQASQGFGSKVQAMAAPIPHFGVVLPMDQWRALAKRLEDIPTIEWVEPPQIRFEGEPGEQATLFIRDPSGNALEFKGFCDMEKVFAQ